MRLIDADRLKEMFLIRTESVRMGFETDRCKKSELYSEAVKWIDRQPTIDPIKHGHWIDDGDCFICSNCRKAYGFLSSKCLTNYCPDCGTKMVKVVK